MKKLLLLTLLVTTNVWADGSRTILKDSKAMDAEINNETVLCSAKGYGLAELKINIKGLDGWTILDHSNSRFGDERGLPCMTAGACSFGGRNDGFSIGDIIKNNPRTEKIVVNRELIETRTMVTAEAGNETDLVCQRSLTEKLNTVVAGVKFNHSRTTATLEPLPSTACHF
ncbi:MAG: hypothetical protein H7177_05510 [Rhizobacter sp.]|nr:hypothetical protein [Bacteriovorax sp.]